MDKIPSMRGGEKQFKYQVVTPYKAHSENHKSYKCRKNNFKWGSLSALDREQTWRQPTYWEEQHNIQANNLRWTDAEARETLQVLILETATQ